MSIRINRFTKNTNRGFGRKKMRSLLLLTVTISKIVPENEKNTNNNTKFNKSTQ